MDDRTMPVPVAARCVVCGVPVGGAGVGGTVFTLGPARVVAACVRHAAMVRAAGRVGVTLARDAVGAIVRRRARRGDVLARAVQAFAEAFES